MSTSCTKTSFRITKLITGKEYVFRVRAENRFGTSEPIYSEKMIARHPFGESKFSFSGSITDKQFYRDHTKRLFSFIDPPSEPINLQVNKVNKESVILSWEPPSSDGGSPITGYCIEKKERNSLLWAKANESVVKATQYTCSNLIGGLEYTFRVSALNLAAQGKPCKQTDFITTRSAVGMECPSDDNSCCCLLMKE